jgi:hypothetical protein
VAGAVAAALIAVLAFTVFGSTTSKLLDPVALAATRSANAPGYKMRMVMTIMAGSASPTPVTATATAVVDSRDQALSMSMAMRFPDLPQIVQKLGSDVMQIDAVMSGGTMYMKLPSAIAPQLAAISKPWIAFDLGKLAGLPSGAVWSSPMETDPSQMLEYLRSISDSIVAAGHQRLDGLETTRYRADLDFSKVPDALPEQERPAVQRALSALEQQVHIGQVPVDVWVDSNHLVRRVEMSLNGSGANGQSFGETMTEDITDYGPQPRPAAPPADQVTNVSGLAGLAG